MIHSRFVFRVFVVILLTSTLLTSLHLLAQNLVPLQNQVDQSETSIMSQNSWWSHFLSANNISASSTPYHLTHDKDSKKKMNKHFSYPKTPPTLPPLIDLSPKLEAFMSKPVINAHPYGYLHNPEAICSGKNVDVLFVIPSAPDNVWKRRRIRKSGLGIYARLRSLKGVALAFFLGLPKVGRRHANITQSIICAEARLHGDIVQENFTDVYSNIRLKAVSMLRWASTYCPGATYVIRTDDDVRFQINNVVTSIKTVGRNLDNFILGDVKEDYIAHRDKNFKYYVSEEEFANDTYPPFALGGLLGYPIKTVRLLYEASLRVKPLWLDDVYITGICAPEVDAKLLSDNLFRFEHRPNKMRGLF